MTLIKQTYQKNAKFVIIRTLKILVLNINHILCKGCHGLLKKAVSFNNIAIAYIKGNAYRIRFWYISKYNSINMMNNSSLIDKMGVL